MFRYKKILLVLPHLNEGVEHINLLRYCSNVEKETLSAGRWEKWDKADFIEWGGC